MPEPPDGVELKAMFAPSQTGLLLLAETVGAELPETVMVVLAVAVQPAASVKVTT